MTDSISQSVTVAEELQQRDPNPPTQPMKVHKRTVDLHEKQTYGGRYKSPERSRNGETSSTCVFLKRTEIRDPAARTELKHERSSTAGPCLCWTRLLQVLSAARLLGKVSAAARPCFPDGLQLLTAANHGWRLKCAKNSIQRFWCHCTMDEILFFFLRWGSNNEGVCNNWNKTKCEAAEQEGGLLLEK